MSKVYCPDLGESAEDAYVSTLCGYSAVTVIDEEAGKAAKESER